MEVVEQGYLFSDAEFQKCGWMLDRDGRLVVSC